MLPISPREPSPPNPDTASTYHRTRPLPITRTSSTPPETSTSQKSRPGLSHNSPAFHVSYITLRKASVFTAHVRRTPTRRDYLIPRRIAPTSLILRRHSAPAFPRRQSLCSCGLGEVAGCSYVCFSRDTLSCASASSPCGAVSSLPRD